MGKQYLTIIAILFSNLIFSQNMNERIIELSGAINYSYSKDQYNIEHDHYHRNHTLQHVIGIQPNLGYFILPNIQLSISPFYNFQQNETNYNYTSTTTGEVKVTNDIYEKHNIGSDFGVIYNLSLSERIIFYGGVKLGINWALTRVNYRPNLNFIWSKNRVTFPILLVGVKHYFSDDWALLMQMQYRYSELQSGWDHYDSTLIIFGIGISTFL